MEVHKHPHHVTHKKKWGEYLLEFFMLFLAVFLGFVAENIREHQVEIKREREYIYSLVEDLKIDQHVLSQHISELQAGILMMDTMTTILNSPSLIANNSADLYYLARLAPRLQPLPINDKTLEQLRNSGNFRLIKNIKVSNKIMDYYKKIPLVRLLESVNEEEFTQYKSVAAKIFYSDIFIKSEGNGSAIKRLSGNLPLRNTDIELLQELSVFAVYMHGTKKGILDSDEQIKKSGSELIEYLEQEYHLQNE